MKFRCEREALAEALSTASRAATGRTGSLPVLAGLRLELKDDRLTITGSDLELTIQLTIEVGGDADGGVVLPARLVADIVRSLGSGRVEVSSDGDDVVISNGRSQFSVRPLSFDDYPRLAAPTSSAVTLSSSTFGEALRQVVRAASNDETRKAALTGVLMSAESDGLRMVATDTYRLALRDLQGQQGLAAGQKVIVPSKALSELQRLVTTGDEVTMQIGEAQAVFQVGNISLTTRLINDEFPAILHLIPPSFPNVLTVEREALMDAIRRMKILAKDSTPLRMEMRADQVRLMAITQDIGNASEEIDATFEGKEMTMAFNPDYLSAGVEACKGEMVTLSATEPMKPVVVRGVGHDEYLYLLMPIRVP